MRPSNLTAKDREFVSEDNDLELLELARAQPQRRHRKRTPKQQVQQRRDHNQPPSARVRRGRLYGCDSAPRSSRTTGWVCAPDTLDSLEHDREIPAVGTSLHDRDRHDPERSVALVEPSRDLGRLEAKLDSRRAHASDESIKCSRRAVELVALRANKSSVAVLANKNSVENAET